MFWKRSQLYCILPWQHLFGLVYISPTGSWRGVKDILLGDVLLSGQDCRVQGTGSGSHDPLVLCTASKSQLALLCQVCTAGWWQLITRKVSFSHKCQWRLFNYNSDVHDVTINNTCLLYVTIDTTCLCTCTCTVLCVYTFVGKLLVRKLASVNSKISVASSIRTLLW